MALKVSYQDYLSALIHDSCFKQTAGEAVDQKARVINTPEITRSNWSRSLGNPCALGMPLENVYSFAVSFVD